MTQYVYAGAGHWLSGGEVTSGGLLRKEIDGRTWEPLTNGLPARAEVRTIAIHPDNPAVVFAGTQDGPYRSTDGGDHWHKLSFPDAGMVVWTIVFHPGDPHTLFLGASPAAIYRSDDAGDSWRRLTIVETSGAVSMGFDMRVIRLVVDPTNPQEMYAGLEVGGVIRSLDGGESWEDCTEDLLRLAGLQHLKSRIGSDTDTEGMMDSHSLSVSPAQPGTVFLATRMGLFRSRDRGGSWADMEVGRFSPLTYARDVQVAPHDANVMYAALSPAARSEDGSLYRSEDLGQTWQRFDRGVTAKSTMMSIGLSRQDANRVYCATRGGQVFGTLDGGETWNEFPLPEGLEDVYTVACA